MTHYHFNLRTLCKSCFCHSATLITLTATIMLTPFTDAEAKNDTTIIDQITAQNSKLTVTVLDSRNQSENHQNNNSHTLSYAQPVRLDQVVKDAIAQFTQQHPDQTPYWLGSALMSPLPPHNKTYTLSLLNSLAFDQNNSFALRQSAKHLSTWLNQYVDQRRLGQNLDYDYLRLNVKHNPLLQGEYQVVLPTTPNKVLVVGATDKPTWVTWHPRISAQEILQQVSLIDERNKSQVSVIQPDGSVEAHSIAYWNQNHQDIAPGATLYVHYEQLFDLHKELNQYLVQLLQNRTL